MSAHSQRPSLPGQIDALRRMIGHVRRYPGTLRPSEVDYEVRILDGAVATLQWLERHQDVVRAAKDADTDAMARRMQSVL